LNINKTKGKSIKKTAKISAIILLMLIGLIIILWTGLRTPAVQTAIAKKVAAVLSEKLHTRIQVGKVRLRINSNLLIKDLLIFDQQNDTMLFIQRFEAGISKIDLNAKTLKFKEILIKHVDGRIKQLDSTTYNFTFIENVFLPSVQNKRTFNWLVSCNSFEIKDINSSYTHSNQKKDYIDKSFIELQNIVIDSSRVNLRMKDMNLTFNGEQLVNSLSFDIHKAGNRISLADLKLTVPHSHIDILKGEFLIPADQLIKNFSYNLTITTSQIYLPDFVLINPGFAKMNGFINLSGILLGNGTELIGDEIKLHAGEQSLLVGNFHLSNLDRISELTYYFDIKRFFTNRADLVSISQSFFNIDTSLFPETTDILDNLSYTGTLSGSLSSISSFGELTSNIGNIYSDLTIKKEKNTGRIAIEGNLKTRPIYLNQVLQSKSFGELSLNINTKGFYSKTEGYNLIVKGNVSHIDFNQYSLDSISIDGAIVKKQFTGRISSFDPNLRFDFDGMLNIDTVPTFNFNASVYYANLFALGLAKKDSTANLSLNVDANFSGNSLDNSSGKLSITDIFYFTDTSQFATDSIIIVSKPAENGKEITLKSEFIDIDLNGQLRVINLVRGVESLIGNYVPSLNIFASKPDTINNFSFRITADYPHPITDMFFPEYRISPGTTISGKFNSADQELSFNGYADRIKLMNKDFYNLNIRAYTKNEFLFVNLDSKQFQYSENNSLKNFKVSAKVRRDSIDLNFNWNNWLANNYSGNINSTVILSKGTNPDKPNIAFDIFPSNFIVLDTLWEIKRGSVSRIDSSLIFEHIYVDNGESKFSIDGKLTNNPDDSINITAKNISLEHLNILLHKESLKFSGILSGQSTIKDLKGKPKIDADIVVDNLSINNEVIGQTHLNSVWDKDNKRLNIKGYSLNQMVKGFDVDGYLSFLDNQIYLNVVFENQNLHFLQAFLEPTLDKIEGRVSGKVELKGNINSPLWYGTVYAKDARMTVTPTMVNYRFSDSVTFKDSKIIFNNIKVYDADSNLALFNGQIWHKNYISFFFNLKFTTHKILAINTKSSDSPHYYGRGYGSGIVEITGPDENVTISVVATTLANSRFYIPLEGKGDIQDNDFITFVDHSVKTSKEKQEKQKAATNYIRSTTNILLDITVTPDAEVQIIFDPKIGDVLKANGNAHFSIESRGDDFGMYGDYRIEKGDFLFTLRDVINKRLEIQPGSTVSWTGDPDNADINMDAVYKVRRASLYDLTHIDSDKENRVPVNCHLHMKNKLSNPTISFTVDVPAASRIDVIDQINSLPEEELNKQILSLLLMNRFTALPGVVQQDPNSTTSTGSNITATTASELLSNQLSNWLSQLKTGFDLGVAYRPKDDYSQEEYEVALSTSLWNDRVILNGNLGIGGQQTVNTSANNNPYTTDFSVEIKVNKTGNIRLKAFQKVNDDPATYNIAPYTQGVGIFYTEDFNRFDDLLKKMFRKQAAKKPDEINENNNEPEINQ